MPGYAWGQATTDVNAGTVQALAEGTTWVKMYCPDTNINYTADVQVHFLEEGKEYYVRNRDSGKQLGVNNQNTPGVSFVWQEDEEFIPSQQFVFESVNKTTPYLYIKNVYSNLYLGVYDNSAAENQGLRLYNKDANADGEKFKVTGTTDKYFKISPKTGEGADPDMVLAPSGALINANLIMQKNVENNSNHEWYLNNFYDAALLAVDVPDLPSTDFYLSSTKNILNQIYTTRHVTSLFTTDQIREYMENSNVFMINTHGTKYEIQINQTQFMHMNSMLSWDLDNMKLALILACYTGTGGYTPSNITNNTPGNFLEMLVCRGVDTAVGFDIVVNQAQTTLFAQPFTAYLVNNNCTVEEAVDNIFFNSTDDQLKALEGHVVIAGNGQLTLP